METAHLRLYTFHPCLVSARLSLEINLRHARECIPDLIAGWGYYDTNERRVKDCASSITKKSETRCNLARRRFDCWLGPLCH
jgi:hypothetical protein